MTSLSRRDREAIFNKVCRLVETNHFNPRLNGVDWESVVQARRDRIMRAESPEGSRSASGSAPACGSKVAIVHRGVWLDSPRRRLGEQVVP